MDKKAIAMHIAIALYIPSHIICMDQPKITIHQYQSECEKTIVQQKTKLENYKTTAIKKNLIQEKAIFENKLEQCRILLEDQKTVFLSLIEQQLNIDKTMWQACMKTIEDIKQFNKANQHIPLPNVFHDPLIPAFPFLLITEQLKKIGINPKRINIYGKTNKDYLYSCQIPMPCIYRLETLCSKEEKKNIAPFIISAENICPGKIIINLNLLKKLSTVHQGALCMRIVEDIVQNSMLFSSVITTFEPLLTDKPTSIINSEQLKNLHAFYTQKLTAFQPSLSNPTTASCMLQLVTDCFHPDFTTQDYKLLAKIDRYWKSLTWIEQQEQNRK